MADTTTNYGFSTPGLDGAANIEVQDENWRKADNAIKQVADSVNDDRTEVDTAIEELAEDLRAEIEKAASMATWYGLCSTSGSASAKTVSCTGFSLKTGVRIVVKFSYLNTASSITLNVNTTGAKTVYFPAAAGVTSTATGYLAAGWYTFVYDGTYWCFVGAGLKSMYGLTLNLNGSATTFDGSSAESKTWYSPTTAGTSGYLLKANGSGAPSWISTIPVANGGTGANNAATALSNLGIKIQTTVPTSLANGAIAFVVEG